MLPAAIAAIVALPVVLAPIAPYPTATPLSVGDNRLPAFVDDDELVLVQLAPDGRVRGMRSNVKLLVTGSGDFDITLPGRVEDVIDQGGDSPPALSDGHVQFLGHVEGRKLLSVESTLDPGLYGPRLPVSIGVQYFEGSQAIDPAAAEGRAGTFREHLTIDNLTGRKTAFIPGQPDRAALATVLEALRNVPAVYTPETDLQSLYPLPRALPLTAPATTTPAVEKNVFAPLSLVVTLNLDAGATLQAAPGADITRDQRGTRLRWSLRLPQDTDSAGIVDLDLTYQTSSHRAPAADFNVTVIPLPGALFEPPGGGDWPTHLRSAAPSELAALAVKAQAGAASLHRIADVSPPVNRPGPGPERVTYILTLDSGTPAAMPAPPGQPLQPQPWAVVMAALVALLVVVNAWWAWSRH